MLTLPTSPKILGLGTSGFPLSLSLTDISGADLSGLIRQASINSLRKVFQAKELSQKDWGRTLIEVRMEHFEEAFGSVRPSVSDRDRQRYEHLRTFFDILQ